MCVPLASFVITINQEVFEPFPVASQKTRQPQLANNQPINGLCNHTGE
jgi:hypothetical protein